jgi:hypothetical protein
MSAFSKMEHADNNSEKKQSDRSESITVPISKDEEEKVIYN